MHRMTIVPGKLVRQARNAAGISQAELARRLGVTQSTIARLESARANPRMATLERTLAAAGTSLEVTLGSVEPAPTDESLLAASLRMSPAERLGNFINAYRDLRRLAPTVRTGDGS